MFFSALVRFCASRLCSAEPPVESNGNVCSVGSNPPSCVPSSERSVRRSTINFKYTYMFDTCGVKYTYTRFRNHELVSCWSWKLELGLQSFRSSDRLVPWLDILTNLRHMQILFFLIICFLSTLSPPSRRMWMLQLLSCIYHVWKWQTLLTPFNTGTGPNFPYWNGNVLFILQEDSAGPFLFYRAQ